MRARRGYPAHLEGHVKVHRGGLDLTSVRARILDEQTAEATEDAVAVFKAKDGAVDTVKGDTLTYEGAKHVATAVGTARADGKDYWVTAPKLYAFLDENNAPQRYETEGDSDFDGPAYKGQAERLIYVPATQQGRAYGYRKNAVVIQKNPYRRTSGPAVAYSDKQVEVLPLEQPSPRGSLEGVQPPAQKKSKPEPAKGKKKD